LKQLDFIITEETAGWRIDKALSTHPEIVSRSQATSLVDRGCVFLDGQTIKPSHKTTVNEKYLIHLPDPETQDLVPYDFNLDVIYEDNDLLVVNKPSGLVVHPAFGHANDTLVNALLNRHQNLPTLQGPFRPGLVHRIDKDTSGLLVIAKNEVSMAHLAAQFKRKKTHRIYYAVVYGHLKEKSGTLSSYLRRNPNDRKKYCSERLSDTQTPTGKLAITHYDVITEHVSGLTLIKLQLETGRTHQIRVHLSELHHPIVGDPVYCNANRHRSLKLIPMRKFIAEIPHMLLHAAELGFIHPITNETHLYKAPWPETVMPQLTTLGFIK
jgi:23S rRNA pseudouridine1911/1915/1917 synthase